MFRGTLLWSYKIISAQHLNNENQPNMIGMSHIDLSLDEEFSKKLLEIFSEMTGLSVIFYTDSGKLIHSEKNWPKLCQEICKIVGPEVCIMGQSKTQIKGLYQCRDGLWCYSQPVEVDGSVVGTFVFGHRRITGRKRESKKVLKQTLSEHNVDAENHKKLMKLMESVDAVRENAFNIELFKKLSFIEQFIIMEHRRASTERRHAVAFKAAATGLAHEFLLPIQSIVADAENLFNEAEDGSELKYIAEDVLQQVIKLSFTAENIRGPLLEERDQFGYEFHDVDIYPIIQNAINLFKKEAKKKNIIINDPVVKGDIPFSVIEMSEPHIKRVFFNLIHNAVKYSYASTVHSERYITVVCRQYRNFYCVDITNYGIGIKPEEISEGLIFEDGYRGELARDRSRIGSGVGLGAVKRIAESHHGYVEAKSEPRGIGYPIDPYSTTVTVCIPLYQPRKKEPI